MNIPVLFTLNSRSSSSREPNIPNEVRSLAIINSRCWCCSMEHCLVENFAYCGLGPLGSTSHPGSLSIDEWWRGRINYGRRSFIRLVTRKPLCKIVPIQPETEHYISKDKYAGPQLPCNSTKSTLEVRPGTTCGDVQRKIKSTWAEVIVLRAELGPRPYWTELDPTMLIEDTCQTLYAIGMHEKLRFILGVVRTTSSDYPVCICMCTLVR